jgi:hypothetical protein
VSACEAQKHNLRSTNTLHCAVRVMVTDADAAHGCHGHCLRALCVVVVGVVCGVTVTIFARTAWGCYCHQCVVCVAVVVFAPCLLWSQVQCVGSWSWSSHAQHEAAITVDVVCVLWSWSSCHVCHGHRCAALGHGCDLCMCGMGPQSQLMRCMCHDHCLCALCVVVAGVVHGAMVMVVVLHVVYVAARGGNGAARRDAVSASSLWLVIIGGFT